MDASEQLFLFLFFVGFVVFFFIVYLFLSTCLGVQLRRSDIWEALTIDPARVRQRERDRRARASARVHAGEYELDDLDGLGGGGVGGVGGMRAGTGEEAEMLRRAGMRGGFY